MIQIPHQHGNSVVTWTCMAAIRTGSLVFTDDVTGDRSSRINSEVSRSMLSPIIHPNLVKLIGQCLHTADG